MNNQKGVTLVSLTIYVIVAAAVVVLLAFLNVNFFARMKELTKMTNVTGESSKFCSSFIRDVKGSNSVLEYSDNELRLSNGVKYEIRKQAGSSGDGETYAIYKDSIKICENIKPKYIVLNSDKPIDEIPIDERQYKRSPYFNYDHINNLVTAVLTFAKPNDNTYEFSMNQSFKLGYWFLEEDIYV